ncbi:MAG: metallophosphoesterase family protein [Bacteroidia bacterium]|nr:metallophosphoesterase family protein [Bacteroidia bacterium]
MRSSCKPIIETMRIAFISDIHEDIVSLNKALRMIERERCDHVVCLGDILGYPYLRGKYEDTRNLEACIALLKRYCTAVVAGNHDLFHLRRIPRYSAGLRLPAGWYELSAEEQQAIAGDKVWNYRDDYPVVMNENDFAWMNSLPEYVIRDFGGETILISHYIYPNFSGFVLLNSDEGSRIKAHFKYLREQSCSLSIFGHLHIEGLAVHYEPAEGLLARLLNGYDYYSFGIKKLKDKPCSISIPALADNGQVNGIAILDTSNRTINALSLNTNRRFVL